MFQYLNSDAVVVPFYPLLVSASYAGHWCILTALSFVSVFPHIAEQNQNNPIPVARKKRHFYKRVIIFYLSNIGLCSWLIILLVL